jgi:membrane-associated PAP2 superfamily phosphatase
VFPVDGAIDLYLIQPWVGTFGDFALKSNWYLAKLNHTYVKQLITAVYISFFALWIVSLKSKNQSKALAVWLYVLGQYAMYMCHWTHESSSLMLVLGI